MLNKELLEQAAYVAGIEYKKGYEFGIMLLPETDYNRGVWWNPFDNSEDAFNLILQFNIQLLWGEDAGGKFVQAGECKLYYTANTKAHAARSVIVRHVAGMDKRNARE